MKEFEYEGFSSVIAMFNCGSMPRNFRDIFVNFFPYGIYDPVNDRSILEDEYGNVLYSAPIENVLEYIKEHQKDIRFEVFEPLYLMLQGFMRTEEKDLRIVHYGY